MQAFTSVTANYIPKARVLAASFKKFHPEAGFHLVLCDQVPAELARDPAPFDSIIQVEELPIEGVRRWVFQHTLVELCTAVKGEACRVLMERCPEEPLLYFDPDIVILAPLTDLAAELQNHDVILTPHLLEPDDSTEAIRDNEICSLMHGVYNLGFLGLAATAEARRFVDWWRQRLRLFCRADIAHGLFTDQRWADLAPAFFPSLGILRDPGYNVATWNLNRRVVSGSLEQGLRANGRPLCFFHFSGFDSGAQEVMLGKYGGRSPVLHELRRWYIARCEELGQERMSGLDWRYGFFENGQPVSDAQRGLYRDRLDLRQAFPEPYATENMGLSYYRWYQAEVGEQVQSDGRSAVLEPPPGGAGNEGLHQELTTVRQQLAVARQELESIRRSRSYRAARRVSALIRSLRVF